VTRGLTPPVDRQREQATLLETFERVRAGGGQVVWIVGEAGIGKSRLLQMFQERAAARTPFLVLGRCSSYSQHSALYPVIELFQQLFGFETDDPHDERRRKLEAAVAAYGPLPSDAAPLLAALFSLPPGEGALPLGLTPERQRERTLEILLGILLRMADQQPVVVGLEDLHWADPSTLEFLSLVMQKGAAARLMLLLSHRPLFSPSGAVQAPATRIRLDRLPDEHVRTMVEHIAGGKRLPDEVHHYIAQKTDGVPIFIEELTRTVLDSGWLVEAGDGYALGRPLQLLAIPATLQDLLLARLDRLGGVKETALLASVLGREFTYEMLHAVAQADDAGLRRDLSHLVDGGLLSQLGEPPLATYTFRHALIQDAAYGLLLKSARQQHHRRVAETLVQRFPAIVESRPELLAHHFTEAGLVEPAVGYWLRAARRAGAQSANVEATAHVRQGLGLLERLPASPGRDALELGLQSALGSATIALKGYGSDEVEHAFARAFELCERLGQTAQRFRAELGLWMYYVVRANYARAAQLAEHLLAMALAEGTPAALVHARYCIGFSRYYLGEIQAAHEAFAEGAALQCDDGDPALVLPTGDDVRIHLLASWGLVLWHRGQPAQALDRCEQALTLARRLAHPYGVVFAQNMATYIGILLRDADRVKAAMGECVSLAMDKGYRYFLLMGGFARGWALAETGAAEEGLATMSRSLQAARGAGALMGQTLLMVHLAGACVRHKRLEEARAHLDQMAAAMEATGERFFEPELHRLRAECNLISGEPGVEAGFQRALEQARRHGDRAQELRAGTGLARLWVDRGRRAEAHQVLAAVAAKYPVSLEFADLREARALLNRLE
jgi:predicted ATPase